jgi:arylsulfatase A-like enzyme/Flp pilus assembly protein TadD
MIGGMLAAVLLLAAETAAPPNLVLVTIDTLRADRVGCYGHAAAATPALDGLAREGVLVEDAVVQVPQTRPSHASIFTGRYPFEHGLRDNYSPPLDARTPTLAALLQERGYQTAAFIGAYPVSRASGLDRGFATFDDPFGADSRASVRDVRVERPADAVVDRALHWLDAPRTRPFFAWVHLFDPHAPYEPPAPYRRRFARRPYDGEVAFADAQVGRLLAWLDRARLRESTLVVVTSDHGEGLGDHGEDEHLLLVYDTTLRVPLLLAWPGRLPAGARVRGQFRSIDLMPTVLELLGQPAPPVTGVSRADALRTGGRIPDNESYAESLYGRLHFGWAALRSLRGEGWKLIDAPRPELYRIAEDPGEEGNLIDRRANVAEAMRARLRHYDAADPDPSAADVDDGAAERLAALGYLGGGLFRGTPSGADPKDKLAEFQAHHRETSRALRLYRTGRTAEALPILERLSRGPTASFNVEYYLGRALAESGRPADAVPHLQKAVDLASTAAPAHAHLTWALARAGRPAEALAAAERGLVQSPENPDLVHAKGALLLRQGKAAAARPWLERARSLDPAHPGVRIDLAALLRGLGELEPARVEAEQAARLAPKSPDARVALGLALGAMGREDAAGEAFRAALGLAPNHPDALFFLAAVELRAGRAAAAVALLERLVREAPDYPRARETLDLAGRQAGAVRGREPRS